MKFAALAGKNREELQTMLQEEQRRLEQLRVQVAEGIHKDVREVRAARRAIAQLETALRNPPVVKPAASASAAAAK
ncbi:MAG: 50S ribosomal protein L29 [bacterium]|nr:50S ribosomal protein L29 [bacterium]